MSEKKKKQGLRTLDEIKACEKDFLTPEDVAPFLKVDAWNINIACRDRPDLIRFPFCVIGTRVKIPRVGFIHWYEWNTGARA